MEIFSNLLIPIIILYIVVYGKYKKIDVYDSFVKGAIDGLKAAWDILPYIIGIFLAIGIFKTGKGLDMLEYDEYTKRINRSNKCKTFIWKWCFRDVQ